MHEFEFVCAFMRKGEVVGMKGNNESVSPCVYSLI